MKKLVPGFLNLTSMYLICIARVRSSSLLFVFHICMAGGPLPASSKESTRLVQYFFATFLLEYDDFRPVVIYALLALDVTCGNFCCV